MFERFKVLDKEHASMANAFINELKRKGYKAKVEVPYNYYGERGFVDVTAWNNDELLACELKPLLINIDETLKKVVVTKEIFLKANPHLAKSVKVRYPLVLKATMDNLRVCEERIDILRDFDVMFWNEDKEVEARIKARYKEYVEKGVPTDIIVTNVCTICNDAIETGALCGYCKKMLGYR